MPQLRLYFWFTLSSLYLLVLLLTLPRPAHSQDPSAGRTQQELRNLEERRLEAREQAQRNILQKQADARPGITSQPANPSSNAQRINTNESPCFYIEKVDIRSASLSGTDNPLTAPTWAWVERYLAGDNRDDNPVGQCLGTQGISLTIKRVQNALIERGFVTSRAVATAQDLNSRTLAITILPGWVQNIRLKPDASHRANQGLVLTTALPMTTGDVLNLRDIEQALENLKRVPTAEADIQIEPSANAAAPDRSDLVISYQQSKPWRFNATLDNSGSKSSGIYQGTATLSLDSPLALNDTFYLTRSHGLGGVQAGPLNADNDGGRNGTQGYTVHYSLPFGYWTWGSTYNQSAYFQTVPGLNQSYIYSGTSTNADITLSRIIYRSASAKTNASVKAWQRTSNNYIDDTEVEVQKRIVGGWEFSVGHKDAFNLSAGPASWDIKLSHKRGTGNFGTLSAPEEEFGEGTTRFALTNWEANIALPFEWAFDNGHEQGTQKLRINSTLKGQRNHTELLQQDRFNIGGRYTVRGFDGENSLSAEQGWVWRNECSFALRNTGQELYVALDTGAIAGTSADNNLGQHLSGGALGLRGSVGAMQYDLFAGGPIDRPTGFKTATITAGFSLSASF